MLKPFPVGSSPPRTINYRIDPFAAPVLRLVNFPVALRSSNSLKVIWLARQKSAAELRAENKLLRRTNSAMAVASVFNTAIRWGVMGFLGWCVYLSLAALAGKVTAASVVVQFLGNVTISKALAYALGGGAIIYATRERSLRRRTIEHLHKRIKQLEAAKDPNRSSSRLTRRGETRLKDRE